LGGFRRLLRRPATTLAADAAGAGLARAVQPMRQRPQIAVAFAFVVAQSGRNDLALVDSARRATPRDAAPRIMNPLGPFDWPEPIDKKTTSCQARPR